MAGQNPSPQNLVFSIKGVTDENKGILESKGIVDEKKSENSESLLKDSLLKTIEIDDYVKAHIYACNLSFAFLTEKHIENNIILPPRIPVASVYLNYYKNKISGKQLFIIYFYFYPAETNKPSPLMDYLNRPIDGQYGIELCVSEKSYVIGEKNKFVGYPKTMAMLIQILKIDCVIKLIEELSFKMKTEDKDETVEEIVESRKEDYQVYQKYMEDKK